MNAYPVSFYPLDMCETCINVIEDLITSGEYSEANERIEEVTQDGYTCPTCLQLEKENI